jgi:anti-anti-sigma factor
VKNRRRNNMEIVNRREKGAVVVVIKGRLDAVSSPVLEKEIETLTAVGDNRLIMDLSELNYISSSGLRIILGGAKRLKAMQGCLLIASLRSMIKEVFDVSGFSSIIPIFDSTDEALKTLG